MHDVVIEGPKEPDQRGTEKSLFRFEKKTFSLIKLSLSSYHEGIHVFVKMPDNLLCNVDSASH